MVGFVGTLALLLITVLSIMSIALAVYVKAVVEDSAAEGARMAAMRGGSLDLAEQRTRDLIMAALPRSYAEDVSARYSLTTAVVQVRAPVPVVGWFSDTDIVVSAEIPREERLP